MRRKRPNKDLAPGQVPELLKWRPRFRVFGMLSGLLGGIGTVVLVQQYGVAPLSRALTIQGLLGGLVSGIAMPSLVFALVVFIHNRRLGRRLRIPNAPPPGPTMLAVLAVGFAVMMLAPFVGSRPAAADVSGPCGGEINGVDLAEVRPIAADAFEFKAGETIRGSFFIDQSVIGGRVGMSMMGANVTIVDEPPDPSDPGEPGDATFEVLYEDISWIGAGLIEVWADVDLAGNQQCQVRFMVNIDGNPLDTVVGKAAAGMAAVGVLGISVSGIGATMEGARVLGDLRRALGQVAVAEALPMDPPIPGGAAELAENLATPSTGTLGLNFNAVTVVEGDNLWSLSETELHSQLGRPPTTTEVTDYWQSVIEANEGTLQSGNPDLIYPGETIVMPGAPGATQAVGASVQLDGFDFAQPGAADATVPTPPTGVAPSSPGYAPVAQGTPGGVTQTPGGSQWWQPPEVTPAEVAAEGLSAAQIGGASAALGVAAALVPARYLLLSKFPGTDATAQPDPRLALHVRDFIANLALSDAAKGEMLAGGVEVAADRQLGALVQQLEDDPWCPSALVDLSAWPPRVGAALAWLELSRQASLGVPDLLTVLVTAPYLTDLLAGAGRQLDRIDERTEWPWTVQ